MQALLTSDGYIADGPGENVFIVKDGRIYTPDLSTSILPGITRDTIIQIAQDLGHTVIEKSLIRSDLYLADEAFMCGTAAESERNAMPIWPPRLRRMRTWTSLKLNSIRTIALYSLIAASLSKMLAGFNGAALKPSGPPPWAQFRQSWSSWSWRCWPRASGRCRGWEGRCRQWCSC